MPEEFLNNPSDDEFDFSSVDSLSGGLPDLTQTQDPKDFDFSAVDKLPAARDKSPGSISRKNSQPMAAATSGGKVRSGYGLRVPPKKGASSFHQGIDISAPAGLPINPADEGEVVFAGEKKGKGLSVTVRHLDGRETEYNHLSKINVGVGDLVKKEAVIGNVGATGVATGPHLDFRVVDNGQYVNPFNELATDPRVDGTDLELKSKFDPKDFDFSSVDQLNITGAEKDSKPVEATDPSKIDFVVGNKRTPALLGWATQNNRPQIIANNPLEIGDVISTTLDWSKFYKSGRNARPSANAVTDAWLQAWNPEYVELNKKFREETGGLNIALVDSPKNLDYQGHGIYKINARPSRAVKALFEAYKENGLEGFNATNKLINQQIDKVYSDYEAAKQTIAQEQERRPYINAIKSGLAGEAGAITHIATNLKYLGTALAVGNIKGYDSQDYLDLINKERAEQESIADIESTIYQPPSFAGKVVAGIAGAGAMLPRLAVAGGAFGGASLPVMVYLENLHKGNRAAALQALPMAIMVGASHGAGQFFNTIGGTSAPFRNITQKDLSLFQNTLTNGESVSIENLSPLARQFVLRGSNASLLAGSSLLTNPNQSLKEVAANLVVGLSFPVGRAPKEELFNSTIQPTISETKPEPLQLEPARINFPLYEAKPDIFGGHENPTNYLPSGEVGQNKYKELFAADLETGFKASTEPANIRLTLDTAALNLLDLRNALKTGSYKVEGDQLDTSLFKQKAIQDAIDVLEKTIPPDAIKFFEDNETAIRTALRGNWDANRARSERDITRAINEFRDSGYISPDEITPTRVAEPAFKDGKLRDDIGQQNTLGTNRVQAEQILNNFFKVTKQGSLQSSLIPYGDVITKKISDLGYLAAFFAEDYYHRGIEPKIDVIANRLRDALGQFGRGLSDDNIKVAFKQGMDYLNSNVADPFFSKMKQDALEKLPNRFTTEQALNILSQHKDEFEWTSGLSEFLETNKNKKINKQDLIDVIQKGQVRIEESVAGETNSNDITRIRNRIRELNKAIYEFNKDQSKPLTDHDRNSVMLLEEERSALEDKLNAIRNNPLKYSTEVYRDEQLELPGAKNSKEVKLISPAEPQKAGVTFRELQDWAIANFEKENPEYADLSSPEVLTTRDYLHAADFFGIDWELNQEKRIKTEDYDKPLNVNVKPLYKSPHWDEPNVVAHYRSNDRVTTDNQKVYFGEEFQSDWNHDIREYGLKQNESSLRKYAESYVQEREAKYLPKGSREFYVQAAPELGRAFEAIGRTKEEAIQSYVDHFINNRGTEPNPFMQHSWKELIMKRFLRDAAIAKDENGNYKYDGIGWTTARQQLERYGEILEGKEFKWSKNADGTYSFYIKLNEEGWQTPHELRRISLERFAELTTKEAADFVREQENKINTKRKEELKEQYHDRQMDDIRYRYAGQFSLKEAVELRKGGMDKYGDYDVAYKNILSKIGKRFGAKYSEKELVTGTKIGKESFWSLGRALDALEKGQKVYGYTKDGEWKQITKREQFDKYTLFATENEITPEKIHYLEITPSMRQSLEKEGLPLYGIGGSEPVKNPEVGIRNRITTREAFDQHRNDLVKAIEEAVAPTGEIDRVEWMDRISKITDQAELEDIQKTLETRRKAIEDTFNSGLNPDALIDQFKLLYSGVQDFADFSSKVLSRFGNQIKPFLQDLWIQVKGIQNAAMNSFNDLSDYLQRGKDSPVFKSRQFREGGFFGIGTKESQALKDYKQNKQREGVFRVLPPKLWRGIGLAQADLDFGEIYNVLRRGQRARNSFESGVLANLKEANDSLKGTDPHDLAEVLFQGNEQEKVFSRSELAAKGLSPEQMDAYESIRKAEDLNLEWRKQHVLYGMRERADKLNDKLLTVTPGSTQHTNILSQMIDLGNAMSTVEAHFDHLKNSGYISLVRIGNIVGLANDAAGNLLYNHFDSTAEANKWVLENETKGATGAKIYDLKKPEELRIASAQMTPGQFEDLVDQAGINPNSPDVEALRSEIYARYPSFKYELKRDYTAGYDRNWKFLLESVANQTEVYANSFYSRVAGNEAMKKLSDLDLYNKNYEMYQISKKFIDDEISSPDRGAASKLLGGARKAVYLINLGYDINQLYLNAIAQPITQTYSYFARVEHNGIKLGRAVAEKYFAEAGALVNKLAAKKLGANVSVDPDFEAIYDRLKSERVIEPEFNRDLLLSEAERSVQGRLHQSTSGFFTWRKQEHWASVFMRAGEKTTRSHAAAEAFLVGKNKFGLAGEELVDFIVRAVDATQSNPSRGEAPFYVRKFGEAGKLFYQFNAFNHMWLENLALNVRADFRNNRISATARHLAPLVIMGGIRGLPLAGFAFSLYTLTTGDDLKKKYFDQWFKNNENLERLALYGITTSPSLSQKLTPGVPIADTFRVENSIYDTVAENLAQSTIPALSTGGQILRGFDDLISERNKLRGLGEISPRAIRGPLIATRYSSEGVKTRTGSTIVPKNRLTTTDIARQTINITPPKVSEYYEERKQEGLKKIHNQIKRRLNRIL